MRNPEFDNRFSFSGQIARIRRVSNALHVTISQCVAGMVDTEFRLVVPFKALLQAEEFPFSEGEWVLVQDAVLYEKENHMRLRINKQSQIRACSQNISLNILSFSGQIVEKIEEKSYELIRLKQTVNERFITNLQVLITKDTGVSPDIGEVGYITSALLYEKEGTYRAKIEEANQYKCLYSPNIVMELGRTDAKERFA